jgi:hypothetical protein
MARFPFHIAQVDIQARLTITAPIIVTYFDSCQLIQDETISSG